jgi:hypothetical protein
MQIIIAIFTTGFTCFYVQKQIEKHSVHPIYGNYKKFDSEGRTCQPWDSCPK